MSISPAAVWLQTAACKFANFKVRPLELFTVKVGRIQRVLAVGRHGRMAAFFYGGDMTKAETVYRVMEKIKERRPHDPISQTAVEAIYEAIAETILEALAQGDSISLPVNLGTFRVQERAARTGRNPRTGQEITIPARKAVKFTPGKATREAMQRLANA